MQSSRIATIAVALLTVLVLVRPAAGSAAAAPGAAAQATAFYADVREKRYDAAVAAGAAYHAAHPNDDRFSLDYAYALLAAHRTGAATALLERLRNSAVPAVRVAARRQLRAQAPVTTASASVSAPAPAASPPPFTNAYELLAGGDLAAARDAFVSELKVHPDDAPAWRQLSYIDFVLKDRSAMIDALHHYIALEPNDDRAKLELAYALLADGQRPQANAALLELTHSSTPEIAAAAQSQLTASLGASYRPARFDAFGYGENDSRFHDTFYGLDLRYALAPTRIEPYLAFHLSNDAKASGLPATEILNDNVIILAAGLRTLVAKSTYVFVEGGEAQSLRTGRFQTDLRYGILYSNRLGAGGYKSQTQIDASVTHYSRYINTIAYGNLAHDFYIGSKVVRGVVGANVALDTSRAFYNNAFEGFGGVQIRRGVFTLRLVAVAGTYLGRGIDPPERFYSSIRPVLLFGYSH